ncbi:MAG: pantetheine-phosphate adenylyltransferase [Oscillospiraceae bacterium]|nr:pantetheine-phosphate adenylyltransferase [Oscillospiraceae bacterium]MBQ9959939.1 pantetheine-phosphate adenylyltransferase [Oscillospiraceae bacterium]
MRIAVCPGSFDPITKGHLDIIKRASLLFDKVIVVVLQNPAKVTTFTADERVDFIRRVTADIPNVEADSFNGLLVDYMDSVGAIAIVKGLRAVSDFEYEFQMSLTNRRLNPAIDTVFLNTAQEYLYLSSSMVKQIAAFGGEIRDFIPEPIFEDINTRLQKGN